MIKQNIKIAIFSIVIALGLWLIASAFIKLDYSTTAFLNFTTEQTTILLENKVSSYIEKNNIEKVKIEYEQQFFDCRITYEMQTESATSYIIYLPTTIPRTTSYLQTTVIIDSLNIYKYIFKK